MCAGGFRGSQVLKQNWIISIRSRVIVILPIWVFSALGGGGCLGWSAIVYMSSGMFRGKESSNRIELSRLVQDLNFAVLGSLWLWGGGKWVGGVRGICRHGGCPPHMHTHAHACTRTYTHVYMYRNCKWPPTWRHPCLAWLACLTCMCMCVYVHGTSPTHPYPLPPPSTHPPPPQGVNPQNQ